MSSITPGVPYVAPWQTEFQRYSTQIVTMQAQGSSTRIQTIPAGQWWRIAYILCELDASSGAGTRSMLLKVLDAKGNLVLSIGQAGTTAPSQESYYTWGPGLASGQNNLSASSASWSVASIPDVLWPPAYVFSATVVNTTADTLSVGVMAAEVYTEDYNNPGALVPVATPTIG